MGVVSVHEAINIFATNAEAKLVWIVKEVLESLSQGKGIVELSSSLIVLSDVCSSLDGWWAEQTEGSASQEKNYSLPAVGSQIHNFQARASNLSACMKSNVTQAGI